jgi:hypothetical protein
MGGYVLALCFLALCSLWLFAKSHNEHDEFAGLAGHGVVALVCLLAVGLGIQFGVLWLSVAAAAAFAVNLVLLVLRIRHT